MRTLLSNSGSVNTIIYQERGGEGDRESERAQWKEHSKDMTAKKKRKEVNYKRKNQKQGQWKLMFGSNYHLKASKKV